MATNSLGLSLSMLAVVILVSILRTTYALDSVVDIPLSPLELQLELDDQGILLGPQRKTYDLTDQSAPPHTHQHEKRQSYGSGQPYWYSQIKRQGSPAYGANSSYVIWRNVLDYGAVGDGVTDDTDAFNRATADGFRCGFWGQGDPRNCDSQTTTPAIIYVPGGRTYMISAPVIMWYYTHMVGDANDLPVLKATSDFQGIGILDSDPYIIFQQQWYQNQNNFWRNVRNFVFDTTSVPLSVEMHGIHWQVSQASSIMNCVFICPEGGEEEGNNHMGIFMDNGSSLFMEDLIFIGGLYGFFAGNQQFNVRNLTFNRCDTGLFQNWGWVWSYKSLTFNDCRIGIDLSMGGEIPSVGSIVVADSDFNNCDYGIITAFSRNSTPSGSATMVLDNILFTNTDPAVAWPNNSVIVPGNQRIDSYIQGAVYTAVDSQRLVYDRECYQPSANRSRIQQLVNQPIKSPSLLDENGKFVERSKPQYEGVPVENFISIMDFCCTDPSQPCVNDGVTDATACVQAFMDSLDGTDNIGFIDHGAYVIRDTITVPSNVRLQGEVWPLFMVTGDRFQDEDNPYVAFRVGQPGDIGNTEMVEILFETIGPTPGAILMEWNLECQNKASCGMWDSHWRIGGSNGTQLQNYNCKKTPTIAHGADPACYCAFLILHITRTARNVMFSHNWIWISDHELDLDGKDQIDIYNGRGMLVESEGPLWLYGSGSEHNMLYNYQFSGASNIYIPMMQSETAYMQDNPNSLASFKPRPGPPWHDPTFENCFIRTCYKTIAVRIFNSTYIYSYGSGLYSFFQNYDSTCITTTNCDQYRVYIDQSQGIYMYAMSSIAAENMVIVDGVPLVPAAENYATFANTIGGFFYP
ncbi:Putative pectate lyase superfamily protein [Septoria linicola]|uniref:Pectate lyase superfamily protein n=1 Tax=Septoria linicola TaxID=215465 RepID=A0A9Q9EKD5_9PEZI|nr:Putative pectate lyase superfamily protein [Septoria linicola]